MFKFVGNFDTKMGGSFEMSSQRDWIEMIVSLAYLLFFGVVTYSHNPQTASLIPVMNVGLGAVLSYWFTKSGMVAGSSLTSTTVDPTVIQSQVDAYLQKVGQATTNVSTSQK